MDTSNGTIGGTPIGHRRKRGDGWDDVLDAPDFDPEKARDAIDADKQEKEPSSEEVLLDNLADSLQNFFQERIEYEFGRIDEPPQMQLEDAQWQALAAIAGTGEGRYELYPIISQGFRKFREVYEENELKTRHAFGRGIVYNLDAFQDIGRMMMDDTIGYDTKLMDDEEIERRRPQAEFLKALGFDVGRIYPDSLDFNATENLIKLNLATEEQHNRTRNWYAAKRVREGEYDDFDDFEDSDDSKGYFKISDEAHAYWNELSRAVGKDMFVAMLEAIEDRRDQETMRERCERNFEPDGMPKDEFFQGKTGLFNVICGRNSAFINKNVLPVDVYLWYVEQNLERIPEDKRWIIQDAGRICRDENGNVDESKFFGLCDILSKGSAWENSDDRRPNAQFWNKSLIDVAKPKFRSKENKIEILKQITGFEEDLTEAERTFIDLPDDTRDLIYEIFYDRKDGDIRAEIAKYVTSSGVNQDFVDFAWELCYLPALANLDFDSGEIHQTEHQRKILEIYSGIKNPIAQMAFSDSMIGGAIDYESLPIESLDHVADIITRISESNAGELRTAVGGLVGEILRSNGDYEHKIDQIEAVFLRNHLPYFAKAYITFNILNPPEELSHKIDAANMSPVLKDEQAHPQPAHLRTPRQTIFCDMVKCAFYSNNRSVRDFLYQVETGQELLEQVLSGDKQLNALSPAELRYLDSFAKQLTTLYNQTARGREQWRADLPELTVAGLNDLVFCFEPSEQYSLGDRIVRMFAYPVGIKSIAEAKELLASLGARETERHRKLVEDGRLGLEAGDVVKGIGDIRYISNILQNGSVAKEFLGENSDTDATPLDTDVSVIQETKPTFNKTLMSVVAGSYGGDDKLWVVMKGDDRFATTRQVVGENGELAPDDVSDYSLDKLELFSTGVSGRDHFGIRTGFPSSDIDFFVKGGETDRLAFEIVKNGFYIPIVSPEGELLFSPEQYEAMRQAVAGHSYYGEPDYGFGRLDSFETRVIAEQLDHNNASVRLKRQAIEAAISSALRDVMVDGHPIDFKTTIDGDITPGAVELIDTGSTGRGTSVSTDSDFDFIMRVDRRVLQDENLLGEIKQRISEQFTGGEHDTAAGDFRFKGVTVPGLDTPVDLDISFLQRTNKMEHSTDAAIRDVLASIARKSAVDRADEIARLQAQGLPVNGLGPTEYELVIANIIAAKEFFKSDKVAAYKPNRGLQPQGGLGGVGIENWILQHGGSFEDAARSFLDAVRQAEEDVARQDGEGVSQVERATDWDLPTSASDDSTLDPRVFERFKQIYQIWDFGQNHFSVRHEEEDGSYRYPHDNFVTVNMSYDGFTRIVAGLRDRFGG